MPLLRKGKSVRADDRGTGYCCVKHIYIVVSKEEAGPFFWWQFIIFCSFLYRMDDLKGKIFVCLSDLGFGFNSMIEFIDEDPIIVSVPGNVKPSSIQ